MELFSHFSLLLAQHGTFFPLLFPVGPSWNFYPAPVSYWSYIELFSRLCLLFVIKAFLSPLLLQVLHGTFYSASVSYWSYMDLFSRLCLMLVLHGTFFPLLSLVGPTWNLYPASVSCRSFMELFSRPCLLMVLHELFSYLCLLLVQHGTFLPLLTAVTITRSDRRPSRHIILIILHVNT
jgi:hypothetical protein